MPKVSKDTLAARVDQELQRAVSWRQSHGLHRTWRLCEKFRRGEQWPEPTEATRNFPRPVLNIIRRVVNQKVAVLLADRPEIQFFPRGAAGREITDQDFEAARLLTPFADFTYDRLLMEDLGDAVVNTAADLGTGIMHFYWDESLEGEGWKGDIAAEEIDPEHFHVGNPQERSIQKQPWVLIQSRVPLEVLPLLYPDLENVEKLQPEPAQSERYATELPELAEDSVTLTHRVWRENNGTPEEDGIYHGIVCQGRVLKYGRVYPFRIYPIAAFHWEPVRKRFWATGEVEALIPNQKALNELLAMDLLSKMLVSWPKLVRKVGAIKQKLTNTPGEDVVDHSAGPGWGVQYLQPGVTPTNVVQTVEFLMKWSQELAAAHEVAMGKSPGAELNAAAIALLQRAAGVPTELLAQRWRRTVRDCAMIWLAFWKHHYKEPRQYRIVGPGYEVGTQWFDATKYQDLEFDVQVVAAPSSAMNQATMIQQLDRWLEKDRISFEDYLEVLPPSVFPYRDKLLERIRQRQQEQIMQALQALLQGGGAGAAGQGSLPQGGVGEYPPPVA